MRVSLFIFVVTIMKYNRNNVMKVVG